MSRPRKYKPGQLLTPKQVAELLQVTPATVTRWCRVEAREGLTGWCGARRVGRVWRIPWNDFMGQPGD